MNKQRQVIYNLRSRILRNERIREEAYDILDDIFESAVTEVCDERTKPIEWDLSKLVEKFTYITGREFSFPENMQLDHQEIFDTLRNSAREIYAAHAEEQSGKLLRSKGMFWLASRPQYAGQWSQAGGIAQHGAAGMFWKAVPKDRWPEDKEQVEYIMEKWVEPFGDMRQELVFIGRNMNQEQFIAELNACLLTDEEMLKGQEYWTSLADPFPSWYLEEA
jgi:G3E family GTPase